MRPDWSRGLSYCTGPPTLPVADVFLVLTLCVNMTEDIPYKQLGEQQERPSQRRAPGYLCALLMLLLLTVMAVLAFLTLRGTTPSVHWGEPPCSDPCSFVLVESIPEGLTFNSSSAHPTTSQAWQKLMREATSSLDIASFYWTLTNRDTGTQDPSAGQAVLKALADLSPKLSVRIAVNSPQKSLPANLQLLQSAGAQVRTVNMKELTSGVLHTKFWVVDKKHVYIGSANMDWRSLTQVKELGAVVYNCSCLAADLEKIFEAYWYVGQSESIPSTWPSSFSTDFNQDYPMKLQLNHSEASLYLSSSPPSFCASGRTSDLQAVLGVIEDAKSFIYIAVMNYLPTMEFSHPKKYWDSIDSALRRAAYERSVAVRLLVSCWASTSPVMFPFLRSLASLQEPRSKLDIQVRLFVVPATPAQKEIPFARVNHNKYMVTDRKAYIGTSNWSGDYFVNTAGVALVVQQPSLNAPYSSGDPESSGAAHSSGATVQAQLQQVFERDWASAYSSPLSQGPSSRDMCAV